MQKIKFGNDTGTDFFKELNQKVKEELDKNIGYTHGGIRMAAKIITYFLLVFFSYFLMIRSGTTVSFFIWYLLFGITVLLTAFNISHDAAHNVAVKSKFLNKLLFELSFNLQGNNAAVWGAHHTASHHLYTNIEGSDIDVLNNPMVRMTNSQRLKPIHRFQHVYIPFLYLLYSLNWFLFREFLMIWGKSSRTINIKMSSLQITKLVGMKVLYIGYMIIIPAVILPYDLSTILLAFLANHFIVSIIFTAVLAVSHLSDFVHHPESNPDGTLDMSWPMLQLKTSVDYNPKSRFLNLILGGFNAHTVHHLLPHISHVHYLRVLPIFEETAEKYGIPYMKMNYTSALKAHFRFLKAMGTNETFIPKNYEKQAY